MNLANTFTLIRLLICPFFLLFYLYPASFGLTEVTVPFALLGLFVLSEVSDAMDGWAARKYSQVTELGMILDPMADSIARTSAFLTFTQPPVNLPIFLVFVLIYRDSLISTLRTICALKGFALAARMSGKVKAVLQALVIFA
ncbi:MAG: CDP-alcohol phosphatidyltransferase family protein, partial [Chlamydiia bacterium]|nr:CDP-alcohol phosphatidyltransferase family protein [Chlamydiia bacterium]